MQGSGLESVCSLNIQIFTLVLFIGFQGVVRSTGLSPRQQASPIERVSIKAAARMDFLRHQLGSGLTTWGSKREGCNVLQMAKLSVFSSQGWKKARRGGNREMWAPWAIFLLKRHVLVVRNSCMFYVDTDDKKCMLEWNQEDTLYENKNFIYLILTWIGEVWGWKYERPEGKVMHWL